MKSKRAINIRTDEDGDILSGAVPTSFDSRELTDFEKYLERNYTERALYQKSRDKSNSKLYLESQTSRNKDDIFYPSNTILNGSETMPHRSQIAENGGLSSASKLDFGSFRVSVRKVDENKKFIAKIPKSITKKLAEVKEIKRQIPGLPPLSFNTKSSERMPMLDLRTLKSPTTFDDSKLQHRDITITKETQVSTKESEHLKLKTNWGDMTPDTKIFDEDRHPFIRSMNSSVVNDKERLEKAFMLNQIRTTGRKSPKADDANAKCLVKVVDKMIIGGTLPMDAVEFFHPEQNGLTEQDAELMKTLGSWNELNRERQKYRVVHRLVPQWLRDDYQYKNDYIQRPKLSRIPIFEICSKPAAEREDGDLQFTAKWLEKIDVFSKFPHSILMNLAKRLKAIKLKDGEALCKQGDYADSLYVVYQGELAIIVEGAGEKGRFKEGMTIGRPTLDTPSERKATLRATRETYIIMLYRNDYKESIGDLDDLSVSKEATREIIFAHPFFKHFTEMKKLIFLQKVTFRKCYKNEVIYDLNKPAGEMYMFLYGKIVRELPIKIEKQNRWPATKDSWQIKMVNENYLVTLPFEPGDMFGVHEMINDLPREEKIIVLEDSFVISLGRNNFFELFDEGEVYQFRKKAGEDIEKKRGKLREIFEEQSQIEKIKAKEVIQAYERVRMERGNHTFRNKDNFINEWKDFEKGFLKERNKEKKLVKKPKPVEVITKRR